MKRKLNATDDVKGYVIVEEVAENGNLGIVLLHRSWLSDDMKTFRWPLKNQRKKAKNEAAPEENWLWCTVSRVRHQTDDYNEALALEGEAVRNSDVGSEFIDEENHETPQRFRYSRQSNVKKSKLYNGRVTENVDTEKSGPSSSRDSYDDIRNSTINDQDMEERIAEKVARKLAGDLERLANNLREGVDKSLRSITFQIINEYKKSLPILRADTDGPPQILTRRDFLRLPISAVTAETYDFHFQDKSFTEKFNEYVRNVTEVKIDDLNANMYTLLDAVYHEDIGQAYSWEGIQKRNLTKLKFKDFKHINIIHDYVESQLSADTKRKKIEKRTKSWLTNRGRAIKKRDAKLEELPPQNVSVVTSEEAEGASTGSPTVVNVAEGVEGTTTPTVESLEDEQMGNAMIIYNTEDIPSSNGPSYTREIPITDY